MQGYKDFDQGSFFLGMIQAFSEVVMQQVKELAFSPVMEDRMWQKLKPSIEEIFEKFGLSYYLEKDLISTDLAPDKAVKGKIILLIYLDSSVLAAYKELKKKVQLLQEKGLYDQGAQAQASLELRRLLSYSDQAIKERRLAAYDS